MPRMSKKAKLEWDFFLNPNTGKKNYNLLCRRCLKDAIIRLRKERVYEDSDRENIAF